MIKKYILNYLNYKKKNSLSKRGDFEQVLKQFDIKETTFVKKKISALPRRSLRLCAEYILDSRLGECGCPEFVSLLSLYRWFLKKKRWCDDLQ